MPWSIKTAIGATIGYLLLSAVYNAIKRWRGWPIGSADYSIGFLVGIWAFAFAVAFSEVFHV